MLWNLRRPGNALDLVESRHVLAKSSVHTQNLFIDECGDWQHIKAADKLLPHADVEPPLAFLVESVDLGDILALVVASEEEHTLRELYLVGEEQADALDAALASVNIVAQKEVV